jgi:hexosaminidase
MSYFHWHVTDSQSFPLDVPAFPGLAGKGAYSASEKYSPVDIASVVSYGAARGIAILPEIDTPGHTTSIYTAYPEHIACVEASPWVDFANEPPAGQLRFASENTTAFVAKMFSSAASLFEGPLFSTGGDELNTNCYDKDEETQKILKSTGKTLAQALEAFTNATHSALRKSGKTPAVWEEMVLDRNLPLPKDTVVLCVPTLLMC